MAFDVVDVDVVVVVAVLVNKHVTEYDRNNTKS